jgi:DNA-binding MarR family transcriptional regulator
VHRWFTTLNLLEQRGLLKRQLSNSARNANDVILTEQGLDVLLKALDLARHAEREIMKPLSTGEQSQLKQLTSRLNLQPV